jgi:hypothetical protein
MLATIKALFSGIVDYAGLFPPAQLSLSTAMANYVQYQASPNAWMLGRFVLPASRLAEFVTLLPSLPLQHWPLSLILTGGAGDMAATLAKVRSLQSSQAAIAIQALEFPVLPLAELTTFDLPPQVEIYFEVPLDQSLTTYLAVLQNQGVAAKVRTGGVTATAFPSVTQLCELMVACAQAQVPFKATAGLHHPLPGDYPLTYEPESDKAAMHGFLSVALTAAYLYWQRLTPDTAASLLQATSLDQLLVTDTGLSWNHHSLSLAEISTARKQLFRSFGSCSFMEPIAGLQALNLLP